jgi:hypothetical protein
MLPDILVGLVGHHVRGRHKGRHAEQQHRSNRVAQDRDKRIASCGIIT